MKKLNTSESTKQMEQLSDDALSLLAHLVKSEQLIRQWKERQPKDLSGLQFLANFLNGAAHAMACRWVLRWSKGHYPLGGKKPEHGGMWNPADGAIATHMLGMLTSSNYGRARRSYDDPLRGWPVFNLPKEKAPEPKSKSLIPADRWY